MISGEERRLLKEALGSLSGTTQRAYEHDLELFAEWCEGQDLAVLRASSVDLNRWTDELLAGGDSPNTVRRRLAALTQFYRLAHGQGLAETVPTEGARRPAAVARKKAPRLKVDTARALLRAARAAGLQQEVTMRLLLVHSLGATEVAALKLRDVDQAAGALHVPGQRARSLLLTSGTLVVLGRHLDARGEVIRAMFGREPVQEDPVFANSRGRSLGRGDVWRQVKALGHSANVEVPSLVLAADVRPLERYLA